MNTIDREKTKQKIQELFAESPSVFALGFEMFSKLVKITNNPQNRLQLPYYNPEENLSIDVEEYLRKYIQIDSPMLSLAVLQNIREELPDVDFFNAQNVFMILMAFKDIENERVSSGEESFLMKKEPKLASIQTFNANLQTSFSFPDV